MSLWSYIAECQRRGIEPKFVLVRGQALFNDDGTVNKSAVKDFTERLLAQEEPDEQ